MSSNVLQGMPGEYWVCLKKRTLAHFCPSGYCGAWHAECRKRCWFLTAASAEACPSHRRRVASYTFGCREGRSAEEPGCAGVSLALSVHRQEWERHEEHMAVLRFRTRSSHSRRTNALTSGHSPRCPCGPDHLSMPGRVIGGQHEPRTRLADSQWTTDEDCEYPRA